VQVSAAPRRRVQEPPGRDTERQARLNFAHASRIFTNFIAGRGFVKCAKACSRQLSLQLLGRIMTGFLISGLLVGSAVVAGITIFNVRGRRRERKMQAERGAQTAADFASLFDTATERFIAGKLFPYLQMSTFTKQFSFRLDDKLWEPPLQFVKDDVEDNLHLGFWDDLELGLSAEHDGFGAQVLSARTIGDLVHTIAAIYRDRYGAERVSSE